MRRKRREKPSGGGGRPPRAALQRTALLEAAYAAADALRVDGPAAARAHWSAVRAAHDEKERAGELEVREFSLVHYLGARIAAAEGDHLGAAARLHAYFGHPLAEKDTQEMRFQNRLFLARSLLFSGDAETAGRSYEHLILYGPRRLQAEVFSDAQAHLLAWCRSQPPEEIAPEPLARLASRIALRRRQRKAAASIHPGEAAHGLLARVLEGLAERA